MARQVDVQPVFNRQVRLHDYRHHHHPLPSSPLILNRFIYNPDLILFCWFLILQLISELSDTVTACLVDITDVSSGLSFSDIPTAPDVDELLLRQQLSAELGPSSALSTLATSLFRDLESDLRKVVANADKAAIRSIVAYSETGTEQIKRILRGCFGGLSSMRRRSWRI